MVSGKSSLPIHYNCMENSYQHSLQDFLFESHAWKKLINLMVTLNNHAVKEQQTRRPCKQLSRQQHSSLHESCMLQCMLGTSPATEEEEQTAA